MRTPFFARSMPHAIVLTCVYRSASLPSAGATRESVNKWEQQAKSRELRAAMSMARLWRDQGKRHGARDLLAPVYGWFTGDFDTCDLNEAKALLDTLAS